MNEVKLVCRECAVTGELGLVLADMRQFDEAFAATEGALVAHDLLEHVNGPEEIGGVGDELEALGAVWVSRGALADLNRKGFGSAYTPAENLASDVVENWRHWCGGFSKPVPNEPAIEDFEDDLRDILRNAIQSIPQEDEEAPRDDIAEFIRGARHFMRAGYRKMLTKYNGDKYAANSQFWAVADAVEPFAKHCEYEGQEYIVTYGDGQAACAEQWENEDGDELSCDDCSEYFTPEPDDGHRVNSNGHTQCPYCVEQEEDD